MLFKERTISLQCSACLTPVLCSPVLLVCQPPTLLPTAWWDNRSPTSPHWWLSSRSSRSSCSNEKVNSKGCAQMWKNHILDKHSNGFVRFNSFTTNHTLHQRYNHLANKRKEMGKELTGLRPNVQQQL